MDTTSAAIFILSAFVLGAVILMSRNQIPERLRKPLALTAIVLVAFAFLVVVMTLFSLGT
ncbi:MULTISPECIES: hypothetical protein [Paenibacillus]|uniref:hypothetical protein n=1 Tax=Paenibacillus TaxID=44249 RepID=UPI000390364D|nr:MULTISPECIES: hypothetical protein [Paenibacillus]KKC45963.1 signal transduction histidine kinase [Paenibacillus sp. D9]CDN45074.1 hypothetical protein BN871_GJ_00040 [Paenibacillus sp. P22]